MARKPDQWEEETLQRGFEDVLEVFDKHRLDPNHGFSVALAVLSYIVKQQNDLTEDEYDDVADLIAETVEDVLVTYLGEIDE